MGGQAKSVIPFISAARSAVPHGVDQLDKETILGLLHKAAGVAEANSQRAIELAQKFSHQLRAAEDRIAELEAEVDMYREKADHAEQWLHRVYTEIEDRFLPGSASTQAGRSQFALSGPKFIRPPVTAGAERVRR